MAQLIRKRAKRKNAVQRAYAKLETAFMAMAGRNAIRSRGRAAKAISRKAAKAALIAGSLAAAKVLLDEVRERRKRRKV